MLCSLYIEYNHVYVCLCLCATVHVAWLSPYEFSDLLHIRRYTGSAALEGSGLCPLAT